VFVVVECSDQQQRQLMLNEIGLLNVRINDMVSQLNRTVNMLLETNQKLTAELQQLKASKDNTNVKAEKTKPL
jgi:HPt (histidine-containing phosphotransfer) domain-containing protein